MRAGRLRHRLTLQAPTETRNEFGEAVISWVTQADNIPGGIEPLSGREYFSQQAVQAEAKVRIVMRYRSDINATWRIVHDGLYYAITEPPINENLRDRMLILMCAQGVKDDVG